MVAFFTPIVHAGGNPSIYDAIAEAGLTTNLKLVLDAGDSQSYDGTSQKWLDRSGGGYDFFLGSNGTIQSTDPTFNGTAGRLTSSEFFSVDGGDYFSYDAAIESWMQNIGKNGGIVTIMMIVYVPADTTASFLSTKGSSASDYGMALSYGAATDGFFFSHTDSTGAVVSSFGAALAAVPGLSFVAVGTRLTAGQTTDFFVNGVNTSAAAWANNGTGSNPVNNMKIMTRADVSGLTVPSGGRVYGLAIWEGTRLTTGNFTTLWNRLRSRFGL